MKLADDDTPAPLMTMLPPGHEREFRHVHLFFLRACWRLSAGTYVQRRAICDAFPSASSQSFLISPIW